MTHRAFAVAAIEKWWQRMSKEKYPDAHRIFITADGGGPNGRAELFGGVSAELGVSTGMSDPTAAMLIRVRVPLTSNSPTTSHHD